MTKKQVGALAIVWQERMLLDDWSITVVVDATLPTAGHCEWDPNYSAKISLLPGNPRIMERVLVHELCHILMHRWDKPKAAVESTVEHLTNAFLRAYPARRRRKPVVS
jgi:hypothetical protein